MPYYDLARKLRRQMTPPELLLWSLLKKRDSDGVVFRRQHAMGNYILDFYCKRAKLCVEVDGVQHSEDAHIETDVLRDAWLRSRGIEVYRIAAGEVFNDTDEVVNGIVLLALSRLRPVGKAGQ